MTVEAKAKGFQRGAVLANELETILVNFSKESGCFLPSS